MCGYQDSANTVYSATGPGQIVLNEWAHFACVISSANKISIYKNGVLVVSKI